MQKFSVGEWVQRRYDNKVGVVRKVQEYHDDYVFYVDFNSTNGLRSPEGDLWAGTTQAWRSCFSLHAHVSSHSRDCDGDYSAGHLVEMSISERCDQFGDLKFKDRVITTIITTHGYGTLEVQPEKVEWHEETDEGFRHVEARWCEEDCWSEGSWQRDHRAEAMGY